MVEQSYKELPYRLENETLRERDMNLYRLVAPSFR